MSSLLTLSNLEHCLFTLFVCHFLNKMVLIGPKKAWKIVFTAIVGGLAATVPGVSGVLEAEKKKALADSK